MVAIPVTAAVELVAVLVAAPMELGTDDDNLPATEYDGAW